MASSLARYILPAENVSVCRSRHMVLPAPWMFYCCWLGSTLLCTKGLLVSPHGEAWWRLVQHDWRFPTDGFSAMNNFEWTDGLWNPGSVRPLVN